MKTIRLAMLLLEEKDKLLAGWTWEILATNLNDNSLETARAGIYGPYALRDTSARLRRKYFKDVGNNKLQANDLLKAQIRFDRVNLSDDRKILFRKGLDVIFCCNVLIYFDLASKRRVVQHFYSNQFCLCGDLSRQKKRPERLSSGRLRQPSPRTAKLLLILCPFGRTVNVTFVM